MPSTEKLTRLGIFLATGYLCAGIVVAIFVGLPLWVNFFSSEFYIGALITIVTMLVAAVIGVGIMRALVSRYGLKPIFDMDVLILMIGVLFLALAMNQAMVVVGLLVTIGGGTLYFIENFSVQMKAASQGGTKALSLVGWALGPIIAVAALTIFADHGLLTLRILLAHYIVIAFWVWVQRLSLHEDYAEAPEFLHRMYESYQHLSAIRAEQDLEIKKNRFAVKVKAPEQKATPVAQATPAAAPAEPKAAPVEPKAAQAAPTKPAAPKAESVGLTVESVMAAPKAEPEAPQAAPEAPKAEEVKPAEESKPAAQAPQAEVAAESPKAEDKPAEESKAEAPKAEDKPAEESKAEAPKAEDKPAEESKAETEAPKAEDKPAEESKAETEAPKSEDKPAEEPKAEEQPAETPKKKKKGWLW